MSGQYERQTELNKQQLENYRDNIANLESQTNSAKTLTITLKEENSSYELLITKKIEEITEIDQNIEECKKRIEDAEFQIDEINREINILARQVNIEKPQLEAAEEVARNKGNPSYFHGTIHSNVGVSIDKYTYSERESIYNNGVYKGSKVGATQNRPSELIKKRLLRRARKPRLVPSKESALLTAV